MNKQELIKKMKDEIAAAKADYMKVIPGNNAEKAALSNFHRGLEHALKIIEETK